MTIVFKRPGYRYWYAWIKDPRVGPPGLVKKSTKRETKTAALVEAAALQAETDDEVEAEMESRASACGLTWMDAITLFVKDGPLRESTAKSHISIGLVVESILGDFDLGQLTSADLKRFVHG